MTTRVSNVLLGVIVIAVAVYVHLTAGQFRNQDAAQLPYVLAITMLVLGAVLIGANLRRNPAKGAATERPFKDVPWRLWLFTVGMTIALVVGMTRVGFYETAFVFLAVVCATLFRKTYSLRGSAIRGLAFAVVFSLVLFVLMDVILGLRTPSGILLG